MRDNDFVMKIKNILSFIVFSAAFIFSVMLIGLPKDNFYSRLGEVQSSNQTRQNIQIFLWQDINRGRDRNEMFAENSDPSDSAFNLNQLADSVQDYADEAQSSDDTALPADLQAAWHAHMDAWRTHSDFLNSMKIKYAKNSSAGRFPVTPFDFDKNKQQMLDDYDQQTYLIQSEKINQTWYQVLRTGRKYGVYVPIE